VTRREGRRNHRESVLFSAFDFGVRHGYELSHKIREFVEIARTFFAGSAGFVGAFLQLEDNVDVCSWSIGQRGT
jgi:hypothetical protein